MQAKRRENLVGLGRFLRRRILLMPLVKDPSRLVCGGQKKGRWSISHALPLSSESQKNILFGLILLDLFCGYGLAYD